MRPYMTEEEAKEKWCPYTAILAIASAAFSVSHKRPPVCGGSECMFWGWEHCETQRRGRCEAPGGAA